MSHKNKALQLLRDGFQEQFAEHIVGHTRFVELVMELAEEFIDEEIPLVNEEDRIDLAFLLMETITP